MKQLLFLLIIPASLTAQWPSHKKGSDKNKEKLDVIISNYYKEYEKLFPVLSESKLYPAQLENYISQPHRDAQRLLYQTTLRRLRSIDKNQLPDSSLYDFEV